MRLKTQIFILISFLISVEAYGVLPFNQSCKILLTPVKIQEEVLDKLFQEKRIQEAVWVSQRFGLHKSAQALKEKLVSYLSTATIISKRHIEDDNFTEVYIVKLSGGMHGIFKPEPKYWKNKGQEFSYLSNLDAEISAYDIANVLGIPVPVTIEKVVDGMRGSLQVFIDKGDELSWQELRTNTYSDTYEIWNSIMIFDYLIGNTDRSSRIGRKNYLEWNASGLLSLAAYDHSMAFVKPGNQRGRFAVGLGDFSFSINGSAQVMHDLKYNLTPKLIIEILKRRNHSPEVIKQTIKNREILINHYETTSGPI